MMHTVQGQRQPCKASAGGRAPAGGTHPRSDVGPMPIGGCISTCIGRPRSAQGRLDAAFKNSQVGLSFRLSCLLAALALIRLPICV